MSTQRRVVIVGASAAGLRCASRLKRLQPGWKVTVVEQREVFSYAACGMPYVLSGDIASADQLRRTHDGTLRNTEYFSAVKDVEVKAGWRAAEIDAGAQTLRIVGSRGEQLLPWDELVLATGTRPRQLPEQPDHARVRTFHALEDVESLHDALSKGKIQQAVIVGAGFLGCELAEAFRALWGIEVALLEAAPSPMPMLLDPEVGDIVTQVLRENGVQVRTGAPVERIEAVDDEVTVHVGGKELSSDVVIVALGVEPAVELARQVGARLGTTGAIAVDDRLSTSIPHIWAAGDNTEVRHVVTGEPVYMPLGSLANRQGRTLANILAGREDHFPPVAGAAALKVFDCNVAAVGVSRTRALAGEEGVRSVWLPANDRAEYWPESAEIAIHLVYEPASRRVIGVQVVGEGETVKRIDVAAQLIARGATLEEFAHLEHAYSPPYSPALEPLAVAAMVAQNLEDGVGGAAPQESLGEMALLDVRNPEESEARPLPAGQATVIPLGELRDQLSELTGRPWLVVCERGVRSAEAVRLLRAKGVDARYLFGGLRWRSLGGKPSNRL